ncbi:DUF3551 domain-containing protein [Bradyrhizobium sp. 157]|nr:DUF3551 domain-containing protein [Bradyrhizobium sp. 157]
MSVNDGDPNWRITPSTPIRPTGYPWCLQGRDWGYPGQCQFWTYNQCMATASGTVSYCGINPLVAFAQQRRGYWREVREPKSFRY